MSPQRLVAAALEATPTAVAPRMKGLGLALAALGAAGLALGFLAGPAGAGWTALLVATALAIGLGVVGVLVSAMFQLTGARWGRAYRRLAEAGVVLMPVGLLGVLALLAGGGAYLPWVHEHPHVGGKAVWLTRGFWDARVLLALLVSYGVALRFLYFSLRRDFCMDGVGARFTGGLARFVSRGIEDPERERERCEARLAFWAPLVAIVYAVMFSLLGFDLIMALEPDWFSTLFGAWYFIGHLFVGLALLAILSVVMRRTPALARFLTDRRQSDLATLLFAFCLVNTDFFWSQYLTIWYGNLPEETGYVIERSIDGSLPWSTLSWVSLFGFFGIPFVALLFRKVKVCPVLLPLISLVVVLGIFLARFLEVAPALMDLPAGSGLGAAALPLAAALMAFLGVLGVGLLLYARLLTQVPILPVGDPVFLREFEVEEEAA